jgi:hypothetical protein
MMDLFSLLGIEIWKALIISSIIGGIYVYLSFSVGKTSERLGVSKEWSNIVWFGVTIPYLMANSAKKPWWPTIVLPILASVFSVLTILGNFMGILGLLISLGFLIYTIYLKWHICELRFIHGWWALLTPGLFILAILFSLISQSLYGLSIFFIVVSLIWYLILWGILAWSN